MRSYHPVLWRGVALSLAALPLAVFAIPASADVNTDRARLCAYQNVVKKDHVLAFKVARTLPNGNKQVLVDRLERTGRLTTKKNPTWRAWLACGPARRR